MIEAVIKYAGVALASTIGLYGVFIGLLAHPGFQAHAVYLHKIQMTWFKNLNVPESFGFLRNQVTPFQIPVPNAGKLFAWHVLPIDLYHHHEKALVQQPIGLSSDVESTLAFKLLCDDPQARLILHFHGAAGTVGSGYRVPNYRALSASQTAPTHVLTFDYRGFGKSLGHPSETGLIEDAVAVVEWALNVAKVPSSRIAIFSQSLGTAVNLAIAERYALRSPPTVFAGHILVAPFVDTATLVASYRIAGTIPLLSPLAKFPLLFEWLRSFVRDKWASKDRIATYINTNELNEKKYRISMIHAKDDYDIPWQHTEQPFWHAVQATTTQSFLDQASFESLRGKNRTDLGAAGTVMEWATDNGRIREEILETGLHDVIMGNPVISLAVMRIFEP